MSLRQKLPGDCLTETLTPALRHHDDGAQQCTLAIGFPPAETDRLPIPGEPIERPPIFREVIHRQFSGSQRRAEVGIMPPDRLLVQIEAQATSPLRLVMPSIAPMARSWVSSASLSIDASGRLTNAVIRFLRKRAACEKA